MATQKFLFGTLTELGTNLLASLANSTSDTTGLVLDGAIDNSANLHEYIQFEVNLAAPAAAYAANAYLVIYAIPTYDGTNYVDATNVSRLGGLVLTTIPLSATTDAHRVGSAIAAIPWTNFKILVQNKSGQAFNATTASLKYRTFTDQSV